jgi:hypothetical protein
MEDICRGNDMVMRARRTPKYSPSNIIVDMYAKAKAAQGMSAEDAVKWADGDVRKICGRSIAADESGLSARRAADSIY